jgi:tetratricopeptide (TPR) repeat protein
MSGKPYEVASVDELRRKDGWSPIRLRLGVEAFGVNAWTAAEAGADVIPEHGEEPSGHQELYVVTAGHATFTVEGNEIDAPAGTIVFVRDAAAKRGAKAKDPNTTVLAVGGKPGHAYKPRAWETNGDVFALLDAGKPAEAKRILVDALDRYEDNGSILYNLACAEAQLGEKDEALEHLKAALEERPDLAAAAPEDHDLEPLRDDSRFAEIVDRQA